MAPLEGQIANSVHMVLGMNTEIGDELQDAIDNDDVPNILEELGDAEWYIANYATIWGFVLPDEIIFPKEVFMDLEASKTIAKLQD